MLDRGAREADVLDAIVTVADHPIRYSIQDYAVVFSLKGPETPELRIRVFKVDPNTFVQGLEAVSGISLSAGGQSMCGNLKLQSNTQKIGFFSAMFLNR